MDMRVLALVAGLFPVAAHAATGMLIAEDNGKSSLIIIGSLEDGDYKRINSVVSQVGSANISGTILASEGGDVETAFRLSDLVNVTIAAPVYVISDCLSACAFIALAAGSRLHVIDEGRLAVHEVWVKDGQADLKLTKQIVDWLKDCGVPASIRKKILDTTPQNMATITRDELRAMGASVNN